MLLLSAQRLPVTDSALHLSPCPSASLPFCVSSLTEMNETSRCCLSILESSLVSEVFDGRLDGVFRQHAVETKQKRTNKQKTVRKIQAKISQ